MYIKTKYSEYESIKKDKRTNKLRIYIIYTGSNNVTRWLNYLPQRAEVLTHRSLQSLCNLMVELFASTGRDFDSSIKFNAPTCEKYCE